MLRDLARALTGARADDARARRADDARDAHAASAPTTRRDDDETRDDDDARRRATFADRWMQSWTDDDVTFLGEDPYGDCAGNIFAQAAMEARRRASVDETRAPRASGDARDDDARRASMDERREDAATARARGRGDVGRG